jgi:hypothetical protein
MFDATGKRLIFDPYFLEPPLCILCIRSERPLPVYVNEAKTLDVTPILDSKWLYWVDTRNPTQSSELPIDSVPIGEAGGRRFYARSYADFAEFVLTNFL